MRTPRAGTPLDPSSHDKPDWALSPREAARAGRARPGEGPTRWPWVALLIVLLVAGALGWQYRDALAAQVRGEAPGAGGAAEDEAPEGPSLVQINGAEWAIVEPVTLRRTVKVIGPLSPVRQVELSVEAGGRVEEVGPRPGDRVAQGDPLVQVDVERLTLERDLAQSTAEATRVQLALAETQLERSRALVDRGIAAATTLDEAESAVDVQAASLAALDDQVAAAELSLAEATVTAPFDGVVAARSVEPGAVVAGGTPLLTLVDLDEVEMLASAPVAAGPSIRAGQRVEVAVDGVAGRTFEGRVARIAPVAAEGTRTIVAYVTIDNADRTLLGGMFATGEIVTEEVTDAVALPTEALRVDDEGDHVLVIEEGALVRRAVTLGEAWEGGVTHVTEGLAPGDAVITVALPDLAAGTTVELVEF